MRWGGPRRVGERGKRSAGRRDSGRDGSQWLCVLLRSIMPREVLVQQLWEKRSWPPAKTPSDFKFLYDAKLLGGSRCVTADTEQCQLKPAQVTRKAKR